MAKPKNGKRNEVVAEPAAVVADSQSEQAAETVVTDTQHQSEGNAVTFTKVSTHKNGLTSYSLAGLRGSIYVGKGVFGKDVTPPDTIEVSSPLLVQPTQEQIERAAKRAERKTRVKQTLSERLAKAEEKARKSAERLAKLQAKADKEAAKNAPAAPAEPAFADAPATDAPVTE